MIRPFIAYESREALALGLAGMVAEDLRTALAGDEPVTLAVPGGSTPGPFLRALGAARLDWSRINVLATDERWVPSDDPRSNEAMIMEALGNTDAIFIPFWRADTTPTSAAETLAATLRPAVPLTATVLGMGEDMHCASLFPGAVDLAPAMDFDAAPLVTSVTPVGGLEPRVTLSARMLAGSGTLRLLITGPAKREVLEAALAEQDPMKSPVGAVLRRARRAEVHWAA